MEKTQEKYFSYIRYSFLLLFGWGEALELQKQGKPQAGHVAKHRMQVLLWEQITCLPGIAILAHPIEQ